MSLEICNLFSLYLNSSLYRLYSLANKLAILIDMVTYKSLLMWN